MERGNSRCVVTTRCVTGSVYFKLTENRKGKRLGAPLATEPLGKTKKPQRSSLKTRCRVAIVARQRNYFNVKATNRPDDLRAPPSNRLESARLATKRASDATEWAFFVHATESGGVLFNLMHASQFGVAIHIARQAN